MIKSTTNYFFSTIWKTETQREIITITLVALSLISTSSCFCSLSSYLIKPNLLAMITLKDRAFTSFLFLSLYQLDSLLSLHQNLTCFNNMPTNFFVKGPIFTWPCMWAHLGINNCLCSKMFLYNIHVNTVFSDNYYYPLQWL